MTDPTGTYALRRSFLGEANRRLSQLRSLTHTVLVQHDLMAARNDPVAMLFGQPGHRLATFTQWFEQAAAQQMVSTPWWERFLQRAYQSGTNAGADLVGSSPGFMTMPVMFRELAAREFQGITAAMVQQVARAASGAAVAGHKPAKMYRTVLAVLRSVGQSRMKAAVDTLTVQLHNTARLTTFHEAGIGRVGLDVERLEPPRPSRFGRLKHDHAFRDDSYVKQAMAQREAAQQALEEAQAATAQAELEASQAHARVEVAQAKLETAQAEADTTAQEAAQGGWTPAQQEYRNAKAQAAAAAAATAQSALMQAEAEADDADAAVEEARQAEAEAAAALAAAPNLLSVLTAGDEKVCQQCQDLAAEGPYTLQEAWSLLPAHVHCRCAWIPASEATGEE
jgi:hypothetical protein